MPSSKPVLSVILPAFNAEKYIKEAIDSILNQTFKAFELIIADDGSNDNTKSIIDSYEDPRIKKSHNTANQGKSKTVNRLFKLVKGEYFTIHDADDYSDLIRFEKQIEFLSNDLTVGVCGSSYITINKDGTVFSENNMPSDSNAISNNYLKESQIHGPTAIIRTDIASKFNCIYREYFKDNYEDTDLIARVLSNSKGYNLSSYLYFYRILPNSLCRKNITIRNRNLYQVVAHLAVQRLKIGVDDLEIGNEKAVDDFFNRITQNYVANPSLIHNEGAAYYQYYGLKWKALRESLLAFYKNSTYKHLKLIIYCAKKIVIK